MELMNREKLNQPMQWHWEPSHYKAELGEVMLQNMRGNKSDKRFGVSLNPHTVAEQVAEDERGLKESKKAWESLKAFLNIKIAE